MTQNFLEQLNGFITARRKAPLWVMSFTLFVAAIPYSWSSFPTWVTGMAELQQELRVQARRSDEFATVARLVSSVSDAVHSVHDASEFYARHLRDMSPSDTLPGEVLETGQRLVREARYDLEIAVGRLSAAYVEDVRVREYSQRIRATLQNMDHDVARYGAFLSTYSESGPVAALDQLHATSQRTFASPEAIAIAFEHHRGWSDATLGVGSDVQPALNVIRAKLRALGLQARLAIAAFAYSVLFICAVTIAWLRPDSA